MCRTRAEKKVIWTEAKKPLTWNFLESCIFAVRRRALLGRLRVHFSLRLGTSGGIYTQLRAIKVTQHQSVSFDVPWTQNYKLLLFRLNIILVPLRSLWAIPELGRRADVWYWSKEYKKSAFLSLIYFHFCRVAPLIVRVWWDTVCVFAFTEICFRSEVFISSVCWEIRDLWHPSFIDHQRTARRHTGCRVITANENKKITFPTVNLRSSD